MDNFIILWFVILIGVILIIVCCNEKKEPRERVVKGFNL